MAEISFSKMVGAGNDFVVVDNRKNTIKKNIVAAAKELCDRHRSVGADGLILLENSKKADIRMRIINSDGSEAEMCGNGIRCIAKFALEKKITKPSMTIETLAGLIRADVKKDIVKARLVDPKDLKLGFSVPVDGKNEKLNFINTGVPHTVKISDDLKKIDVEKTGRSIRNHKFFAPKGTNVNFLQVLGDRFIEVRTYERGVENETLACGTGSTAAALVSSAVNGFSSPVKVKTAGGEILKIYFTKKNGQFSDVYLEGRVKKSFEGRIKL